MDSLGIGKMNEADEKPETLNDYIKAIQSPDSTKSYRTYSAKRALGRVAELVEIASKGLTGPDGVEPNIELDHDAVAHLFIKDVGIKPKKLTGPRKLKVADSVKAEEEAPKKASGKR